MKLEAVLKSRHHSGLAGRLRAVIASSEDENAAKAVFEALLPYWLRYRSVQGGAALRS